MRQCYGFFQRMSVLLLCFCKIRAKTNNKSDKRFRYWQLMTSMGCAACILSISLSVRRHTLRAWWHNAVARFPPGKINSVSGGRWALYVATCSSNQVSVSSLITWWPGKAMALPISNKCCWIVWRMFLTVCLSSWAWYVSSWTWFRILSASVLRFCVEHRMTQFCGWVTQWWSSAVSQPYLLFKSIC